MDLTKYRTLHYLNISYGHTHYDIRTLPCVLRVTSLWVCLHYNTFNAFILTKGSSSSVSVLD